MVQLCGPELFGLSCGSDMVQQVVVWLSLVQCWFSSVWPDGSCLSCGSALVQFVADWFDIVQRWVSVGSVVSGMCGYLVKFLFSCGSAVWGLSFFD